MESETIVKSLQKLVIEERKAGLKASAERRRRQNLVSPHSKRFGLHPLEMFPRVVWELIFERLTDPAAIAAAWNACTFFQEIIGDRKYFSQILFPAVFSQKPLKDALGLDATPNMFRECISPSSLFKLRSVCKSWKEGVDQLVTRTIEKYEYDWSQTSSHESSSRWIPPFQLNADVDECKLLDRILDDLGNPHPQRRKSFSLLNRSLHFGLYYYSGNKERVEALLSSKLNTFLEHTGHEVLRFGLSTGTTGIRELGVRAADFYLTIRSWILHMSQLHRLEMDLVHLSPEEGLCQSGAEFADLQEALKSQPFPCLKSLRSLKLDGGRTAEERFILTLYSVILNSNSKSIKDLEVEFDLVSHNISEVDDNFRASLHALENLQSLHVFVGEHLWFSDPSPCFNLNWKLKRLSLTHGVTLSSQLFQLLENFPTLEWLDLGLIFNEESRFDSPLLHLPNVSTVNLRIITTSHFHFINVDFLLPMKKLSVLKWIELNGRGGPVFETDELIQFKSGRFNLNRSNVWEVFPSLRFIEVQYVPGYKKVYERGLRD